jgi:hypothetical protein
MIQEMVYLRGNYGFNRQLISVQKHLMHCEGTTVGLKLPEDGVKKHQNA